MSDSVYRVIYNRGLLTNIFEYLSISELKKLDIQKYFKNITYADYITPQYNTLLYGQVQSGKTFKILQYVKLYKPYMIKIIIIQNNKHMLSQYAKAFMNQNIPCKQIDNNSNKHKFNQETIITIYNKFRMKYLQQFMKKHNIHVYNLILDESDQYLSKIKKTSIFKNAKNILHVTATPFKYVKQFKVDNVVTIKPPKNYVGLDKVEFIQVNIPQEFGYTGIYNNIHKIINNDFLKDKEGFMLINCFKFVVDMKTCASNLSVMFPTTPFIILTSKTILYENGKQIKCNTKDIKSLIDNFNKHSHIVIIANRLSLRGINYTNLTYSRYISHQISLASNNYTNFLQRCRIFGVRYNNDNNSNGKVYCIITKSSQLNFVGILKNKVANIINAISVKEVPAPKPKKITVKDLKALCKLHNIKRYSKLKKNEIIQLLTDNNIPIIV